MLKLDTELFLLLNAGPTPNAAVAWFAIFAAKFIVLAVPFYLAMLWLSGARRDRLTAIALVLGFAIALVLSTLIGLVAFRPRPFMLDLGQTLVHHRPNSSFPSNHGLAFAVWAAVLFMLRRRVVAWLAVALGILVAWSRIYIGIHYPLDMVGAAILGVFAAMASLWIMDRYGESILGMLEHWQRSVLRRFVRL